MKNIKTLIFALLLSNATFSHAAFILEGEQEIYNFTPSDFSQTTTTNNNSADFGFSFANSLSVGGLDNPYSYNGQLELGESIRLDFYENQGDINPFESYTLIGNDSNSIGYSYLWSDFLNNGSAFIPWLDREGSIAFTVLAGEVELNTPSINIYENGTLYSTNLSVAAVPLPPSLSLFAASLFSLLFFRNKVA